jgi:hypothetical protein
MMGYVSAFNYTPNDLPGIATTSDNRPALRLKTERVRAVSLQQSAFSTSIDRQLIRHSNLAASPRLRVSA